MKPRVTDLIFCFVTVLPCFQVIIGLVRVTSYKLLALGLYSHFRSDPSIVRKKYRTVDRITEKIQDIYNRTSEAYFATFVRHYCISAVF